MLLDSTFCLLTSRSPPSTANVHLVDFVRSAYPFQLHFARSSGVVGYQTGGAGLNKQSHLVVQNIGVGRAMGRPREIGKKQGEKCRDIRCDDAGHGRRRTVTC